MLFATAHRKRRPLGAPLARALWIYSVVGLIEWDELKGLFGEAEARGNEPRATCGGGEAVSKRVRCVETGAVYRSVQGAADAVSRSRASLSAAVKRGGTCAGFHWELV